MEKSENLTVLIQQIRNLLAFHQGIGLTQYPADPRLLSFLAQKQISTMPFKEGIACREPEPGYAPPPDVPLAEIAVAIEQCRRCSLHQGRIRAIAGNGAAQATLMIIEDQPGEIEESTGYPFAGEPGAMLDRMLSAMGFKRAEVSLTSIIKCRPPQDRDPDEHEIKTCLTYLTRQIAAVNPQVICTMGPLAAQTMTGKNQPLLRLRGHFHDYHGTPLMATFHPHFLIKNPELKKACWDDLQLVLEKLRQN
ncbi:MAG: uracil-DNA glycosylase [Proteobacteria bacterium]|nr:uracil-DNA glycosylase [Pseudomonadota bacterium]MBU1688800.1 uracil-DNA glycosylase [Pseudomonadota bacterium]